MINMKKLVNVYDMELTREEKEILEKADIILDRIQRDIGENSKLQSIENGEIVFGDELSRVRGVVSAFYESNYFKISLK